MAFKITNLVSAQPIAVTDTTQNHEIGAIVHGVDATLGEGEFIYLLGVASTAVGDVVTYELTTGATVRGVAGSRGAVAVAMSANVASQYGWYQISGDATVNVAAAVADNALVYLTATAGSVDDAVVAGDAINGARFSALAAGAGTTTATLQRPSANGDL